MRRGMNGLALQVQETLGLDPFAGDLFVFRGARGDLIKILWHDGLGPSQYASGCRDVGTAVRHALRANPVQRQPGRSNVNFTKLLSFFPFGWAG